MAEWEAEGLGPLQVDMEVAKAVEMVAAAMEAAAGTAGRKGAAAAALTAEADVEGTCRSAQEAEA